MYLQTKRNVWDLVSINTFLLFSYALQYVFSPGFGFCVLDLNILAKSTLIFGDFVSKVLFCFEYIMVMNANYVQNTIWNPQKHYVYILKLLNRIKKINVHVRNYRTLFFWCSKRSIVQYYVKSMVWWCVSDLNKLYIEQRNTCQDNEACLD